jgi:hypothetical protein
MFVSSLRSRRKRAYSPQMLFFVAALGALACSTAARAQPASGAARSVVVEAGADVEPSPSAPLTKQAIRRAMTPAGALGSSSGARSTSPVLLSLGGVGGWIVGTAAGASVGWLLVDSWNRSRALFAPEGLIAGAAVGAALGAPLGIHFANGGRGDYWTTAGASALALGIGVGLTVLSAGVLRAPSAVSAGLAVGTWTAQIGTAVAVERATAR